MKKTVKLILVGLIGLGIVLGGLSLVYAGNGSNTNSTGFGAFANAVFTMFKPGLRGEIADGEMLEAVATYLGVSVDTLKADLKNGQTLAQIAVTQDKTEDGLINFIVSKRTDELKTALSDGKITQAQHDNMKDNLEARVKEMVERTDVGKPGFGGRGKGLDFNALDTDIANFISVTIDDLRTARESGKSLATIATEHGKTEDALIQFVISKETANLDSLLKDGKITQVQYDNAVKDMATRVKEMVERTETGKPGFANGMGKGFGRGFNFCPDLQNP